MLERQEQQEGVDRTKEQIDTFFLCVPLQQGMLLRAVLLLNRQVQEFTYLQVQVQRDEALPQHVQPVEAVSLAHQLLLAVGMVLQGEQAAAQQVGLPLGHQSLHTRSPFLIKAASVVSSKS